MEEKKKARKEGGEERITRRKIADDPHEKETGTRFSFLFSFFFLRTRVQRHGRNTFHRAISINLNRKGFDPSAAVLLRKHRILST